jgi:c(7)-type cytochrome triheme protein
MELAVTATLVAVGFLAFGFAVKYLQLFPAAEMKGAVPPSRRPELGHRGMPTANGFGLAALWTLVVIGVVLAALARSNETRAAPVPAAAALPAAPAALEAPALSLPRSFTFPRHRMSPNRVTFSHERHVAREGMAGSCRTCHQDQFSIRRPGVALSGEIDHAAMDRGELCGGCHDGRKAFSTRDNCLRCHR